MTVSILTVKDEYAGDGSNSALSTTFKFYDSSEVQVVKRVTATGVETVLTENTHYTVAGGDGATGTVTPVSGASDFPSTVTWTLRRVSPLTQETDLGQSDPLPAPTLEEAYDKLVHQIQELSERVDRALIVPVSDDDSISKALPDSLDRASTYLGFDADKEPVALSAPTDTALTTTFSESLLDDADAATARATLAAMAASWGPRGHLGGLGITRVSATVIGAGPGECRAGSSSDPTIATLVSTVSNFRKLFDNSGWASGDGAARGGVPAAAGFAAAIDTWHFFALVDESGHVDFGYDTSITAANLLADANVQAHLNSGSIYYRRIWSFLSSATPDIPEFRQYGDTTLWVSPTRDIRDVTVNAAAEQAALRVPHIEGIEAILNISCEGNDNESVYVFTPGVDEDGASLTTAPLNSARQYKDATNAEGSNYMRVFVDGSGEVSYIANGAVDATLNAVTLGWVDRRGRDD